MGGLIVVRSGRLAILAALILILGGCTGAASSPISVAPTSASSVAPSAPPTPSPTPVPSPTPAASPSVDLAPLAATYAVIAAGGTAAISQCDRETAAAKGTLAQAKAIAARCRNSYVRYIAALKAVSWAPVQPQVDALIAAADKCDAIVLSMAKATSGRTFRAAYGRLPAASMTLLARADAVRAALGLPPAT